MSETDRTFERNYTYMSRLLEYSLHKLVEHNIITVSDIYDIYNIVLFKDDKIFRTNISVEDLKKYILVSLSKCLVCRHNNGHIRLKEIKSEEEIYGIIS